MIAIKWSRRDQEWVATERDGTVFGRFPSLLEAEEAVLEEQARRQVAARG